MTLVPGDGEGRNIRRSGRKVVGKIPGMVISIREAKGFGTWKRREGGRNWGEEEFHAGR